MVLGSAEDLSLRQPKRAMASLTAQRTVGPTLFEHRLRWEAAKGRNFGHGFKTNRNQSKRAAVCVANELNFESELQELASPCIDAEAKSGSTFRVVRPIIEVPEVHAHG